MIIQTVGSKQKQHECLIRDIVSILEFVVYLNYKARSIKILRTTIWKVRPEDGLRGNEI